MVDLIFTPDGKELIDKDIVRSVYDPAVVLKLCVS